MEDLIEACNEALYEYNGLSKSSGKKSGVKRRQIFDDIKYMESQAINRYRNIPSYGWVEEIIACLENRFDINDKKTNV